MKCFKNKHTIHIELQDYDSYKLYIFKIKKNKVMLKLIYSFAKLIVKDTGFFLFLCYTKMHF